MAKIYYRRIVAGHITIDDVPTRYRKAVEELLKGDEINEIK